MMRGGGYTREVLEIGERVGRGELGVDTSDGILDDDDDEADHLYRLSGDIIRYSGGFVPIQRTLSGKTVRDEDVENAHINQSW